MEIYNIFDINIITTIISIIIFLIFNIIGNVAYKKLKNQYSIKINSEDYLPTDEIHNLKQVFYLIMIFLCFINFTYVFISHGTDIQLFAIIDIIISLYLTLNLDLKNHKDKLILVLLVPYQSMDFFMAGGSLFNIFDIIHLIILVYFMKVYYTKFIDYTRHNALGKTILVLFSIIFVSFITTMISEHVGILDSLSMVSNAFTSNGYAILGKSVVGKLTAILLVWGGYMLSGVGTATLTAAIMMKYFNSEIEEIKDLNRRFDELEELIKNKKD